MIKKIVLSIIRKIFPTLYYYILYSGAAKALGDKSSEREKMFKELITLSEGKNCLQIGVREKRYAPHWVSVDLYDQADYIDYHYDIYDLKFNDAKFDIVACVAILEHIEDTAQAIKELHRVLKKEGLIWIEVPFNQPYHPDPHDYWRVSPDGLRLWMKEFTEISAGLFKINKSPIYSGVYFYGRK